MFQTQLKQLKHAFIRERNELAHFTEKLSVTHLAKTFSVPMETKNSPPHSQKLVKPLQPVYFHNPFL
jgi:hypothetical protein